MRRYLIAVKQRYRYVSFTPATSLVQGKCRNVIPSSQPQFLACTDDRIPDRTRCLRLVLGTYTLLPASTRTAPAHSAKVLASPQAHGTFMSSESSSTVRSGPLNLRLDCVSPQKIVLDVSEFEVRVLSELEFVLVQADLDSARYRLTHRSSLGSDGV